MNIPLTKLYDLLAFKFGRDTAGHLSAYIEDKIKEESATKSLIFATKEDMYRLDIKITRVKSELIKWMFLFWVAQFGSTICLIISLLKK